MAEHKFLVEIDSAISARFIREGILEKYKREYLFTPNINIRKVSNNIRKDANRWRNLINSIKET